MSTVIRVKRSLNEEPLDSKIVLKRRKTDNAASSTSSETSTILKFAGTVNQTTNIQDHIAKLTKEEAKDIVSRKNNLESSLQSRLSDNRKKSQQNRFKIVNCTRAAGSSIEQSEENGKQLTIVDVEKDKIASSSTLTPSTSTQANSYSDISDEPFVYDIYVAEANDTILHSDAIDLNDLSILEYNDYLYSCPRLVNNSDSDDEINPDEDEDSNDENNWRNDYPDEGDISENDSVGERQMRRAMQNFDLENDLSSDDGEEDYRNGFIYSVDADGISFEDDLDYCDVNRYGEAYAKYKKKNLKMLADLDVSDDSDASVDRSMKLSESFDSQ